MVLSKKGDVLFLLTTEHFPRIFGKYKIVSETQFYIFSALVGDCKVSAFVFVCLLFSSFKYHYNFIFRPSLDY